MSRPLSQPIVRPAPLEPIYAPVEHNLQSITEHISDLVLARRSRWLWWCMFLLSLGLLLLFLLAVGYLLLVGVGIWGINIPVAWGFAITDFVWWIGIGHAGTLISAFLVLMHQKWRTSINRLAEAMTIFAVMCAGLFPLLHLGRPWFFFYLLPYVNTMELWPQFRSALVWDAFAVSTYLTISIVFWYLGLIPDLATLRDRAESPGRRKIYAFFALGWRNSARHWHQYEKAYLLLAGLATPLVISVHSVVSSDFAMTMVPAWHETVFPPYFVAGAIFSGFAMVFVLAIPTRWVYGLHDFIRTEHLEVMAKLLLATSWLTSYGYLSEWTLAWYGSEQPDRHIYWFLIANFDKFALVTWTVFICNVGIPQLLWFRAIRRNPLTLFFISIAVLIGMWLERYMVIAGSLSEGYLPSAWGFFIPTVWDFLTFLGSLGVFMAAFLLFARWLPILSIAESKRLLPDSHGGEVGR